MANEHSKFWSKVADRYDTVVDLQIGTNTRAMVREKLTREEKLGRVAEFGCGTGFFTDALAGKAEAVLATDVAPGMLAVAERRTKSKNVKFQVEDCQKPSLPDSSFDTVFLSLVIHFTEPTQTLAEMRRILRPGGLLIIANADPGALNGADRFRWLLRGYFYGLTRYRTKPPKDFAKNLVTERELCNLLGKAGFKVLCVEAIRNAARSYNLPIEFIKAVRV